MSENTKLQINRTHKLSLFQRHVVARCRRHLITCDYASIWRLYKVGGVFSFSMLLATTKQPPFVPFL